MMKKVLAMSILLVGLMANATNGDPNPSMEIKSLNTNRFSLVVDQLKDNTTVQIKDSQGDVIHKEALVKGNSYKKSYDISMLPEGVYYIKVVDATFTKIYSLVKESDKLVLKADFASTNIDDKILAVLVN